MREVADRSEFEDEAEMPLPDLAVQLDLVTRQLNLVLSEASDGFIAVDLSAKVKLMSAAAEHLLGIVKDEAIDRPIGAFIKHGSGPYFEQAIFTKRNLPQMAGDSEAESELDVLRTDGGVFAAQISCQAIIEDGETIGFIIKLQDITKRRQAEANMRLSAAVFQHSAEGLVLANSIGKISVANPAFLNISGYSLRDVIGKSYFELLCDDDQTQRDAENALVNDGKAEWEAWLTGKCGRKYAVRVVTSKVDASSDQTSQYVCIVSDITQRKLDEERILYQANYDALTGLPNRTLFLDRLDRVVKEARRAKTNVGLMFIDLDGFKAVNDSLGHDAGDLLLQGAANRMLDSVRESDTVARLGGDEFTVIMPLLDSRAGATFVANRILKALVEPFDLNGHEGNVSGSIGIAMFPEQSDDAADLLQKADAAMYWAKGQGKANFQFYTENMAMKS